MAFSDRRLNAPKILFGIAFVLGVIAIPIVGPFTFYGSLVPYLAPVLPKPDGAPSDAGSQFHWKGFGLSWHWERKLPSGCASWTMADERYVGVRLSPQSCGSQQGSFGFSNFLRDDDIDFNPMKAGSFHCSIHTVEISAQEIDEVSQLLREAEVAAKGEAETRVITLSQAFLAQPAPEEGRHPCGEAYEQRLREASKWP
jgi:hypothetical protein